MTLNYQSDPVALYTVLLPGCEFDDLNQTIRPDLTHVNVIPKYTLNIC